MVFRCTEIGENDGKTKYWCVTKVALKYNVQKLVSTGSGHTEVASGYSKVILGYTKLADSQHYTMSEN